MHVASTARVLDLRLTSDERPRAILTGTRLGIAISNALQY